MIPTMTFKLDSVCRLCTKGNRELQFIFTESSNLCLKIRDISPKLQLEVLKRAELEQELMLLEVAFDKHSTAPELAKKLRKVLEQKSTTERRASYDQVQAAQISESTVNSFSQVIVEFTLTDIIHSQCRRLVDCIKYWLYRLKDDHKSAEGNLKDKFNKLHNCLQSLSSHMDIPTSAITPNLDTATSSGIYLLPEFERKVNINFAKITLPNPWQKCLDHFRPFHVTSLSEILDFLVILVKAKVQAKAFHTSGIMILQMFQPFVSSVLQPFLCMLFQLKNLLGIFHSKILAALLPVQVDELLHKHYFQMYHPEESLLDYVEQQKLVAQTLKVP